VIHSGKHTGCQQGKSAPSFLFLFDSVLINIRFMGLAILSAFFIRTRLSILNKKKARVLAALSKEERELLNADGLEELADTDPRYVFMT
jgi:hypothetical protein